MFEIVPSIWLIKGKCVRLKRGDFATEEVISNNPIEIAQSFESVGIKRIHLVDLDGARRGEPKNYHILEAMSGYTNLHIDFTGGVSTDGDIIKSLEYGAKSVTIGTLAAVNPALFSQFLISYGRDVINLAADTNPVDNKIKIRGWLKKTEIDLYDHIEHFYEKGLKHLKCSDISRDGVMEGPNFEMYQRILEKFPKLELSASGGVRGLEDFRKLKEIGVKEVVFGRAFYEGMITLNDLEEFLKE